jgi:hypothetical protein
MFSPAINGKQQDRLRHCSLFRKKHEFFLYGKMFQKINVNCRAALSISMAEA